jgi:hypothetical protein
MQQLKQTGASEQEEYFAEGYSGENFFIEQSWNKSVLQFLSKNVSPKSLSWRKMLFEAASNIETTSRNIILEANEGSSQGTPEVLNNFVSKIRQVLVDFKQDVPPDVDRNIRSILSKVQQGKFDTIKSRGIQPGSKGTHTTAKGETRNVQVINADLNTGRVEVKVLDKTGKPVGASYNIGASNFKPSVGGTARAGSTLPAPTGLRSPEAPKIPFSGAENTPAASTAAPISTPAAGTSAISTPAAGTSAPTAPASKQGFFSKLKGALGKGLNWVKNNKWKSLLYAGGLAALAGIAIASGPAAAGAAIAKIAMSKGAMVATGAGGIAGGMQAYQQSGQQGQTGKDRFMSTAKGALKGAGKAFAGAMAGGLIGQGIGQAVDYFRGPQTADIGAPEVTRTSPGETPQQLVDRGHEPLGDKGLDKYENQTGTEFNKASVADQGSVQTGQELNQQFAGADASSAFEMEYDGDIRDALGLGKGGSNVAKAKEYFQSFLTDLQQTNPDLANKIANMEIRGPSVGKMIKQWVNSGGTITASYEYKGDSQLLWEAYQDITRN